MQSYFNIFVGKRYSKDFLCVIVLCLFASLTTLPIWFIGIPSGYDVHQHFQFALTYHNSILSGDAFPGWSAHENYGFGGIGIRFYPPMPYYVLAFARILTNNWYNAAAFTFVFWMILGCIGVYIWVREWLAPAEAVIAALMYSIIPYHLNEIYQSFLYAEYAGASVIPFCFAFLTKVSRRGNAADIILLALSIALLILTHIPTTIISLMSLAVYTIAVLNWKEWRKAFLKLALSFGLGVSASAFHWVKIVTEMSWLNHTSSKFTSGFYNYKNHLFPLFVNSPLSKYFLRAEYFVDLLVVFSLIFLLPLFIYFLLNQKSLDTDVKERKVFWAVISTGIFAFLMTSHLSAFLWKHLPFLHKVQFPWRWLLIVSLIGAVSSVTGILRLTRLNKRLGRIGAYFLIFVVLCAMLFNITQIILPSVPHPKEEFEAKLNGLLHEESYDCWWTVWSTPGAYECKEKVTAGSRQVIVNFWRPEQREFVVDQGEQTIIRVATFYYPHWQAEVNGQAIAVERANDGTILIPLPSHESVVKLYFREPLLLNVAMIVSFVAWITILIGILNQCRFLTPALLLANVKQ